MFHLSTERTGDDMKKLTMILITIVLMGLTGCTADVKDAIGNSSDVVAKETEEATEVSEEETTECTEQTTEAVTEEKATDKSKVDDKISKKTAATEEKTTEASTSVVADYTSKEDRAESDTSEPEEKSNTEAPSEVCTEEHSEEPTEATTEAPTEATTEAPASASVSYSPGNVVSLATAKCKAGGMITTTDNLANLLAEGQITEEEYNDYYPYDGLGYYSVFVETDLNKAATTSGRLLGSEDAIATYIADMLLLESNPYFLIEYGGVYNSGGHDFYEFRCYR